MSFTRAIFENTDSLKVLKLHDQYPGKNNVYKVSVMVKPAKEPIELDYVPVEQVNLARELAEAGCRLTRKMIDAMERMWDEAYQQGSSDEVMSNADESL